MLTSTWHESCQISVLQAWNFLSADIVCSVSLMHLGVGYVFNLSRVQVCLWSKFSFGAVLCCGCSYEKPPFACLALYNTWRLMGAVWPFLDPQYGNVQHIICCDQYATCAFDFGFSNSSGFTRCGHISD